VLQLIKCMPNHRVYKHENPLPTLTVAHSRCSIDFVYDNHTSRRSFRSLTISDEWLRE
jgi:hypothetical protein